MKKTFLYQFAARSQMGVKTLFLCSDPAKLDKARSAYIERGFSAGEIELSRSHYTSAGDTAIHSLNLC